LKITKVGGSEYYELEYILYGLENFPELRPNPKRIATLKSIKNPDENILKMIEVWESGHGVLSKPERIDSLKKIVSDVPTEGN
jgi:hypothetical protein